MKCNRILTISLCFIFLANDVMGGAAGSRSFSAGRSSKSQGSKGFVGDYSYSQSGKLNETPKGESSNSRSTAGKKSSGGMFLSAWGIISLILLVIIGSALIYYVSIFYPIVCAKRGKYDVMEMTAL